MLFLALLTNIYRVLFLFVLVKNKFFSSDVYRSIFIKLMVICDVAIGQFYLWLLGCLYYHMNWKKILSPLKYVGRMALSNYILQNIIGIILFTSLGFSHYETLSLSKTLVIAFLVFIFQDVLSKIWLTYFKFGPLEWLWKCLTYGELLPI